MVTKKKKKSYYKPKPTASALEQMQEPKGCRAIIPAYSMKVGILGVDPRKTKYWRFCQKPVLERNWCCEEHHKVFFIKIKAPTLNLDRVVYRPSKAR